MNGFKIIVYILAAIPLLTGAIDFIFSVPSQQTFDASNHSGAYFSQHSVLYRDKDCRKGGWPMKSPNPHANDMEAAKKLVELSYTLVGLNA